MYAMLFLLTLNELKKKTGRVHWQDKRHTLKLRR